MKKIFSFLTMAAIVFFVTNCGGKTGSGSNGPASIEKAIHTQMQKGNYTKAVEIMIDNLDGEKTPTAEEKAEFIAMFSEKAAQSNEAKGGIKSFEIISEDISEDGLSATVSTKFVYGNGEESTETSKYAKRDGKWKLSMGK